MAYCSCPRRIKRSSLHVSHPMAGATSLKDALICVFDAFLLPQQTHFNLPASVTLLAGNGKSEQSSVVFPEGRALL